MKRGVAYYCEEIWLLTFELSFKHNDTLTPSHLINDCIILNVLFHSTSRRSIRRLFSVGTSSCRVWVSRHGCSRSYGARRGLCWSRSLSTSNKLCWCLASNYAASSNSGDWAARKTLSGKMSLRYEGITRTKASDKVCVVIGIQFLLKVTWTEYCIYITVSSLGTEAGFEVNSKLQGTVPLTFKSQHCNYLSIKLI